MLKISKKEFQKKYLAMSLSELANEFGVSKATINTIRKKLGIKSKGGFGGSKKIEII